MTDQQRETYKRYDPTFRCFNQALLAVVTKKDGSVIRVPMVLYLLGEWLKSEDKNGMCRLHKDKVIRLNGDMQFVNRLMNHMILGNYDFLNEKELEGQESEVATAFKQICQQFLKPVVPFTAFRWLIAQLTSEQNKQMSHEQRIQLNVDLFAMREGNPDDYGGHLTRSNIDTIFYIAELGHIQASHYETSQIDYDAAGFLLGTVTFRPYRIILAEIKDSKLAFANFGFVMQHIEEISKRVYAEWDSRHPN